MDVGNVFPDTYLGGLADWERPRFLYVVAGL
jgi:hypothetical protein